MALHPGIEPFRACRADQRFAYTLLVPQSAGAHGPVPLTVVVHGSLRTPEHYRDHFAPYAERTGSVILAPLFPENITHAGDTESYKFVITERVRFDLALLDMIAEAAALHSERVAPGGVLLHGFSGGGQFAHRFALMHPRALVALSVGAPGKVTLIDESLPWWRGTGGLADLLGHPLDVEALREVPIQLVIGSNDTSEENVATPEGSPHWMEGINEAGRDRMTLLESLLRSYRAHECNVRRDVVDGPGHEGFAVLEPVFDFFERVLESRLKEAEAWRAA